MAIETLEANCVTSLWVKRIQIQYDTQNGIITNVGTHLVTRQHVTHYFGDEYLLFPGMGDVHIHAREDVSGKNNYKEDFVSTGLSALNGGLVHVSDMPNNPIPPIDDSSYLQKFFLAQKSAIPILMYAGIGPNTKPLSFEVPYKVYMGPSVGELYFKNNIELEIALERYRNCWVSFHCEDPEILEEHKTQEDHFTRRPLIAELMATEMALKLIERFGLKGKLCHYSAKEGLVLIKAAKSRGLNVKCEVTPQHLYFCEEDIKKMPALTQVSFQINPPIRPSGDREALLEALKNGDVDFLATDHAPHSPSEKLHGTSGLTGLDTYAAFVTWLIVQKCVDPKIIAKIASENPGDFFNQFLPTLVSKYPKFNVWGKGVGYIEANYSASFTIINLQKPTTITASSLKTKACSSPFLGVTFPGSLAAVFLKGQRLCP